MAFPVLWRLLPQQGQAKTTERLPLSERCMHVWGVENIDGLVGARAWMGATWLAY